ncbi:ABC transporter ATP-binding protein [Xanthomonas cassavae CFBP 4642]|uniref:ABC transporter ATP-binding protein n=1 Tax=Xanthomonas cassavae CFBP 4642 TaxID=1219375 RepID=A0ABS8HJR8_9XANT|nr:ABC transporter ATP-binding protein [Xanthomonas cassavae]MCC4622328.1 ABC transporter ATP-binding protein [Xanthomonas cassavae CFBP 4642]
MTSPACAWTERANEASPVIRLRGLQRTFQTDEALTHALCDVALDIASGEFVSITGPSGCGKSTLMSILGILDTPTAGSYMLRGQEVAQMFEADRARTRNRHIGYIFQSFNLIGDLSVLDNVTLPLKLRGGVPGKERCERGMAALKRVEMAHRAKHLPAQLSGGQQQRVAIARALVGEPSIVLADEPTGNLDSRSGAMVMDMLQELHAAGVTLCMVTHDAHFAAMAQRCVHMSDGRIVG